MTRASTNDAKAHPIGLEHLSLYGDPVAVFVDAAAAGGAASVCLSVNHPDMIDRATLHDARARITDLDLRISMGDGFLLNADAGLGGLERQLALLVELESPLANACAFEPDENAPRDPNRIQDLLGEFCRLAAQADVGVLIEFTPLSHVPTLASAVELVETLAQPNLTIMVDTLHLARAGEGPDDIAQVDPALFGYCQVSDGPTGFDGLAAYMEEAIYERAIPGTGELPLERVLSLLPRDITVSAEVPLRTLEVDGVSSHERARRVLEGSRRVLARSRDEAASI